MHAVGGSCVKRGILSAYCYLDLTAENRIAVKSSILVPIVLSNYLYLRRHFRTDPTLDPALSSPVVDTIAAPLQEGKRMSAISLDTSMQTWCMHICPPGWVPSGFGDGSDASEGTLSFFAMAVECAWRYHFDNPTYRADTRSLQT